MRAAAKALAILVATAVAGPAGAGEAVWSFGANVLLGKEDFLERGAKSGDWNDGYAAAFSGSVGWDFNERWGAEIGGMYGLKSSAPLYDKNGVLGTGCKDAELSQGSLWGAAIGYWPSMVRWRPYGMLGMHTSSMKIERKGTCGTENETDGEIGLLAGAGIEWTLTNPNVRGYGDGPIVGARTGWMYLDNTARPHSFGVSLTFRY